MKKKLGIIFVTIAVIIIIMSVYISKNDRVINQPKYGKTFNGIMLLDKAKVLQDQMKEDSVGNTQGTITYILDDNNEALDILVAKIINQSNKTMWDISEIKNDRTPESKYIKFVPKNKAISSTTTIIISRIKDSKKVLLIISSYLKGK